MYKPLVVEYQMTPYEDRPSQTSRCMGWCRTILPQHHFSSTFTTL